jgi:hypothetical protein
MINQEMRQSAADKKALEEDRKKAVEGPHEEDTKYLEKQAMAGRLFERFHRKLEEQEENDDLSFNLDQLSEESEDASMMTEADSAGEEDKETDNTQNADKNITEEGNFSITSKCSPNPRGPSNRSFKARKKTNKKAKPRKSRQIFGTPTKKRF